MTDNNKDIDLENCDYKDQIAILEEELKQYDELFNKAKVLYDEVFETRRKNPRALGFLNKQMEILNNLRKSKSDLVKIISDLKNRKFNQNVKERSLHNNEALGDTFDALATNLLKNLSDEKNKFATLPSRSLKEIEYQEIIENNEEIEDLLDQKVNELFPNLDVIEEDDEF